MPKPMMSRALTTPAVLFAALAVVCGLIPPA
jgi:hypothetical protein